MIPADDRRAHGRPGAPGLRAFAFLPAAAALLVAGCGSTLPRLPAVPEGYSRASLPPAPDEGAPLDVSYRLLPGDKISVTVRDDDQLNFPEIVVPPEGEIEVWKSEPAEGQPRIRLRVVGLTVTDVRDQITDIYARTRFKHRPYVQVSLVEAVPRVVYVRGEVTSATGIVELPRIGARMTLWRAIQAAGVGTEADLSRVKVSRKDPATGAEVSLPPYDLEEMREKAAFDRDPPLEPNDIILVPKLGKVHISGHIGTSGPYICRRGLTLSRLVAEAGDLKPFAKKGNIRVTRGEATRDERTYTVDLGAIRDGDAPDPLLLPGDRVWIDEDWK